MDVSTYTLDADDVIVAVDDGFHAFAAANGRPDLPDAVIGRPLADFIDGAETRVLIRHLLGRARLAERIEALAFRCDSPHERRHMRLDVEPLGDGRLEVRSRTVHVEARALPFDLFTRRDDDGQHVRVCSWCNRIDAGGWVEAEEAIARLRLLEERHPPAVTHGICDSCEAEVGAGDPA